MKRETVYVWTIALAFAFTVVMWAITAAYIMGFLR